MPRPATRFVRVRLSLEVSQPTKDQIDSVRDRIMADSTVEVIRRAVALYDALLSSSEEGWHVSLRKDKKRKTLFLPRETPKPKETFDK